MTTPSVPSLDALALAWKEYAEACVEHDAEHAKHACEELALHIPLQREPEDADPKTASGTALRATLRLPRV